MQLRPPAVPLVTVDPYFSIWSTSDALHQGRTRHWTLEPHDLLGLIRIDGSLYRFLGSSSFGPSWRNARQPSGMRQASLTVTPTRSEYIFLDAGVELNVEFLSPLLTDDLDLLSRPFSYVRLSVTVTDGQEHQVSIFFGASAGISQRHERQALVWDESEIDSGWTSMRSGTWEQPVLGQREDLTQIDWGYFHLITQSEFERRIESRQVLIDQFLESGSISGDSLTWIRRGARNAEPPLLGTSWQIGALAKSAETTIVLGYDDVVSIDYFGTRSPAFCFRDRETFASVATKAITERDRIRSACIRFDEELTQAADKSGGDQFAELIALAYRQSIAAHKLIADEEGAAIFLSKECTSNGSIGTVDVAYPSTPLYLLLQPELVAAMLRPVFRFAESEAWPEPYAPHDVGTYPYATGQTYGVRIDTIDFSRQMPVEECGNMLIMTAAYAVRSGSFELAERYWGLLEQWADYLVEHGLDPENQLCTDDFAGHLARNANLSIKAIMGIACFALLSERTSRADAEPYRLKAREYATRWMEMADAGDHTRLTFDDESSWSLKYNLVWDRFFGFGLFPQELAEREVEWYLSKQETYGTPLDSRAAFTKTDWLVWAACLTEDPEKRRRMIEPIWHFVNQTIDRTPFTDWYDTHDGREQSFHNRTVIGGIAMPLLMDAHLAGVGRDQNDPQTASTKETP